ncbi:MAG: carbohydrate-binding family 9-like protein [Desulfofustis sp.]|nr:carbohydrate-binding family 9-like protein [Desulfofustis sp.]
MLTFIAGDGRMIARVSRMTHGPQNGSGWHDPPWRECIPLMLAHHMGRRPAHFPRTEVKMGYNATAVHLMFRVEDQFVQATARQHQDSVCVDSCVEFFFTPGPDSSIGYFNIEMNCGGVMLFHFHPGDETEAQVIPPADCERLRKTHTLPRLVQPEIDEPVTWLVDYSLPLSLLARYCPVCEPRPQVVWRANFYKCADGSSRPHWLAWAPVDFPKPNFHLPRFFGTVVFI